MKRPNVQTSKRPNAKTWKRRPARAIGVVVGVALALSAWTAARGQELVVPQAPPAPAERAAGAAPAGASAPALVREGNSALLAKDFEAALQRYTQAKALRPDALELDFNRGLGLFATGKLDEARKAFERAALSTDATLAEGSHYGQAAVDHMEAMSAEDLKQTVAKLERAMRRYHDILQTNPDHAAAREANRKAAMLWRHAREELQKQPPQQDQQQGDGEDQEQKPEQNPEDQPQQQEGEQQEDSKPQKGEPSENQQDPRKGQQSPGEEQQPQDAESQESESEETEEGEQAQAGEQDESASREQAQRELRRLVDQLRERMKRQRREDPGPSRPAPVEKDW